LLGVLADDLIEAGTLLFLVKLPSVSFGSLTLDTDWNI